MAKDFKSDEKGDLVIDPVTHDFQMVNGTDEIAQRIKATLETTLGEMVNLDPNMGSDYSNFFGKKWDKEGASEDMSAAIMSAAEEVTSVTDISFTELPERRLLVKFKATATPTEDKTNQTVEGEFEFGT